MSGPDPAAQVARLDWLSEDSRVFLAGCVSVVRGSTVAAVAEAFGADLTAGAELPGPIDGDQVLGIVGPGHGAPPGSSDAVVVVEDAGGAGADAEVLAELSLRGVAASVYWDAESTVVLSCARDGAVLYSEELIAGETEGLPADLLPYLELVADDIASLDDEPSWVSIAAAMVERFTGFSLTLAQVDVERGFRVTHPRGV